MTKLDRLLAYADMGWRILPGMPGKKGGRLPHASGTNDPRFIKAWDYTWPGDNWSVVCGPESGVLVIDVDGREGKVHLARLETIHGLLPNGPTVVTGSGCGEHRYFRFPTDRVVRNWTLLASHLEARGATHLVNLPPSVHASGRRYAPDTEPFPRELPEAPDWVVEAMTPRKIAPAGHQISPSASDGYVRAAIMGEAAIVARRAAGGRNREIYDRTQKLVRKFGDRIPAHDLVNAMLWASDQNLLLAEDGEESIRKTIRSAARPLGVTL